MRILKAILGNFEGEGREIKNSRSMERIFFFFNKLEISIAIKKPFPEICFIYSEHYVVFETNSVPPRVSPFCWSDRKCITKT